MEEINIPQKAKERIMYKLTSSRTWIGFGLTALITVLFLKQFLSETNFTNSLKWIATMFFTSKAVEHGANGVGGKNVRQN